MILTFVAATAVLAAGLPFATAIPINVSDFDSTKNASSTLAFGLQSYYKNNASGTAPTAVGTLPAPLYWWEAGAVWGGMVDYWAYTRDDSYNAVIQQALMAQVGPDFNYMPPAYFTSLGNDDQSFWGLAVLSALEYEFPAPSGYNSSVWLTLAQNVFDSQAARWDTSTCNGGLRWQIFESNMGYNYKNSISNGGLFQMAARLAHYTGNQTYVQWADKTWHWMNAIGLISSNYEVFDGTDDTKNCTQIDHTQWSYNPAMLIYGTAMLANSTGDQIWKTRTDGLLTSIETNFFSPASNATDVMYEPACEPENTCNNDQYAFKGFLSRWIAKASVVYPSITTSIRKYLSVSAEAACNTCTGGDTGQMCTEPWYWETPNGSYGVGQELSALETVQALLLLDESIQLGPRTQDNVTIPILPVTSTFTLSTSTSTRASQPSSSSSSHASSGPFPRSSSTSVSFGNTNMAGRALSTLNYPWRVIGGVIAVVIAFGGGVGLLR